MASDIKGKTIFSLGVLMKKVLLALSTVLALPAFAVEFESLSCEGTKGSAIQGFKSKDYVDV